MAGKLVRYTPNPRFVPTFQRSGEVGSAMEQAAGRGMRWAKRNAPRDTGTYARSFTVQPAVVSVLGRKAAGAHLINDATRLRGGKKYAYAWAVEHGRGGKHVLQRAVDAIEKG